MIRKACKLLIYKKMVRSVRFELTTAQSNLGVKYHKGEGVKQDYFEAVKWYKTATEQGDPRAQFNLGYMYGNGQGVKQDKFEAKLWYGEACNNKYQKGCDNYKKLKEAGH
jgi:TPR repeat protein